MIVWKEEKLTQDTTAPILTVLRVCDFRTLDRFLEICRVCWYAIRVDGFDGEQVVRMRAR